MHNNVTHISCFHKSSFVSYGGITEIHNTSCYSQESGVHANYSMHISCGNIRHRQVQCHEVVLGKETCKH